MTITITNHLNFGGVPDLRLKSGHGSTVNLASSLNPSGWNLHLFVYSNNIFNRFFMSIGAVYGQWGSYMAISDGICMYVCISFITKKWIIGPKTVITRQGRVF